MVGDAQG
jgi:hypothetical protein